MGTLGALFEVLDGLDGEQLGQPLRLAPDPALSGARRAIQSGEGLEPALAEVMAQIKAARPILRGIRFDLIEAPTRDEESPLERMMRMLRDLHLSAALLLQRLERWTEAQDHFVRAIATGAPATETALWLVDFLRARKCDRDALDVLRTTLAGGMETAFALLEFANDLEEEGVEETAAAAYGFAADADPSGLIGCVIAARRGAVCGEAGPTAIDLEAVNQRAWELIDCGKTGIALTQFQILAASRPRVAISWRVIADILLGGDGPVAEMSPARAAELAIGASELSDERRRALERAASAYALAGGLDPKLEEVGLLQAICLAGVGHFGAALALAEAAISRNPARAERYAIKSLIAFLAGNPAAASEALATAASIDLDNPLVQSLRQQLPAFVADPASRS